MSTFRAVALLLLDQVPVSRSTEAQAGNVDQVYRTFDFYHAD
jgi:hypothetical protein